VAETTAGPAVTREEWRERERSGGSISAVLGGGSIANSRVVNSSCIVRCLSSKTRWVRTSADSRGISVSALRPYLDPSREEAGPSVGGCGCAEKDQNHFAFITSSLFAHSHSFHPLRPPMQPDTPRTTSLLDVRPAAWGTKLCHPTDTVTLTHKPALVIREENGRHPNNQIWILG
jgi:hypothetical protein